jgi:predicted PilT family ATPase
MKTSKLMINLEIIYVCSDKLAKHINTICGQNVNFLDEFVKLQNATISFVMSVCVSVRLSARINSAPTGRIFV